MRRDIAPDPAQEPAKESRRRNTIHIIVTVDEDLSSFFLRAKNLLYRGTEVGQEAGVMEVIETGVQEAFRGFRCAISALYEEPRHKAAHAKLGD